VGRLFPFPGRESHPLKAPGFAWRTEKRLDIEVEHPVVSPAALTRRAHGIDG
jgi:hypothetical protein